MVGQLGTDEHLVHRTMCGAHSGDFKQGCSALVLHIPFKCQNMYLYLHFVSVFLLCTGLALLWPFFSPSLRPVLMVQGYRQVSGRRKDLFYCSGSPVSVGSQGKGWLHYSPLSMTGLTTLMWPHSTALSCYGLFLRCVV